MQKRPKPLSHLELRYLDVDIKRRQLAKIKERAKKRRRQQGSMLILCLGLMLMILSLGLGRLQTFLPTLRNLPNQVSTLWQTRFSKTVQETLQEPLSMLQRAGASSVGALAAPAEASLASVLNREVRVGLQIGHLDANKHPDVLASLRVNTGGQGYGLLEVDVNRDVAMVVKRQLERYGITVDLLPATVPIGYQSDLFISIHADGSDDPRRRGYKSAYFQHVRNEDDLFLKQVMDEAYLKYSGFPDDSLNISGDMKSYYAFNYQRYGPYGLEPKIPAIIVELGYLTNAQDNIFLRDIKRPASALSEGILTFLYSQGLLSRLPYDIDSQFLPQEAPVN